MSFSVKNFFENVSFSNRSRTIFAKMQDAGKHRFFAGGAAGRRDAPAAAGGPGGAAAAPGGPGGAGVGHQQGHRAPDAAQVVLARLQQQRQL